MTGSNGPCKTERGRQYSFYDFHACLYLRARLCEEEGASGWRFGLGQIAYVHDNISAGSPGLSTPMQSDFICDRLLPQARWIECASSTV
jgi:hypothetical protein